MSLSSDIQLYQDHLYSRAYLADVFDRYGVDSVVKELERNLAAQSPEVIHPTLLFLRDASLFSVKEPQYCTYVASFRNSLQKSSIFQALRELLYFPDSSVRQHAVYSFGKTGFPENALFLEESVEWYETNHPDELEKLRFEISWLGNLKSEA